MIIVYNINAVNKVIIKENKKITGRYENITFPGRYILEIYKTGYEVV